MKDFEILLPGFLEAAGRLLHDNKSLFWLLLNCCFLWEQIAVVRENLSSPAPKNCAISYLLNIGGYANLGIMFLDLF